MSLELICESEKWLWESAYRTLDCWNPCFLVSVNFQLHHHDTMAPVLILLNFISGKTRQVTVRHKETVCWNVAWAGAYAQIFWLCGGNPRSAESMLKACCCSKGAWLLAAVHYHFVGGGSSGWTDGLPDCTWLVCALLASVGRNSGWFPGGGMLEA